MVEKEQNHQEETVETTEVETEEVGIDPTVETAAKDDTAEEASPEPAEKTEAPEEATEAAVEAAAKDDTAEEVSPEPAEKTEPEPAPEAEPEPGPPPEPLVVRRLLRRQPMSTNFRPGMTSLARKGLSSIPSKISGS